MQRARRMAAEAMPEKTWKHMKISAAMERAMMKENMGGEGGAAAENA